MFVILLLKLLNGGKLLLGQKLRTHSIVNKISKRVSMISFMTQCVVPRVFFIFIWYGNGVLVFLALIVILLARYLFHLIINTRIKLNVYF